MKIPPASPCPSIASPARAARPRLFVGAIACAALVLTAHAQRIYDSFNSGTNWTTANGGGTASISGGQLTLTSPANVTSQPSATLNTTIDLRGTRQSILVRSHTHGSSLSKTVFFFWANDTTDTSGNRKLQIKVNDTASPANVTAGWFDASNTYHPIGTVTWSPGADGLYLGFYESGGVTHWQTATNPEPDGTGWTDIAASAADPFSLASVQLQVEHSEYGTQTSSTSTVVDCLNYKATGDGYHNIEDKTYSAWGDDSGGAGAPDGWKLYVEAFDPNDNTAGVATSVSNPEKTACNGCTFGVPSTKPAGIQVNCVGSANHFSAPGSITGIHFQLNTDRLTNSLHTYWHQNMYRYQDLPYINADVWTYHIIFKYSEIDRMPQGLEFPINVYTGSYRLQGALAWYPVRSASDHSGVLKVYDGSTRTWVTTTNASGATNTAIVPPSTSPGDSTQWYEVSFTVGLHDQNVYYSGFQFGPRGAMTSYTWNHTYAAPGSGNNPSTTPAFQIDDNNDDTSNTQKDAWVASFNIDWADEKLP